MFSLELEAPQARRDLLIAELWELGSCGITESESGLRAFFEDDARMEAMARRFAPLGARVRLEEERDWVEVARAMWRPEPVGERFFLVPEWCPDPAPPGRLRIPINPGLACGSGRHETTRLCLEALERHVARDMTVLDVGAGAGILAAAAALLGARRVVACDIDPEAIGVARTRLQTHSGTVSLFLGSADAVRSGSVDVLVANISAAAAVELAGEFRRCLRAGGLLLASGFEQWEAPAVERALAPSGAGPATKREKCGWILIETRKN